MELPRSPGTPRGAARDLRGYLSLAQLEEEGPVLGFFGEKWEVFAEKKKENLGFIWIYSKIWI